MKTSYVVFGVSKVAMPILFLLIGFGEEHRARSYAIFVIAPLLVASTRWNWVVKWRLPEHRSSE